MSKSSWLLSVACLALAVPAQAQDTTTGQEAPEGVDSQTSDAADEIGGDIVVTAQRRAEQLSDIPIAVSAVTAESLQNSGANDIRQLNQLAPSLLVSSTGSEANGSARIRGIGTVGDNPGLESSVAVFIDGVYRSRSGIGLNELGEIERVEVLRGPQGTLFGRNASAGLIHIISKKPSFTFGGYGELTYGNYDYLRAAGGVTGPVSDSIALRLDGVYAQRDGFYRVLNPQGGTESRVNDRDRYFIRGQALFEPTDAIEVRIIGDYTKRDESCCGAIYKSTLETFDPTPGVPGDFSTRPNRILDVLASLGGVIPPGGGREDRIISITPGRTFRGSTEDWGVSGEVNWDFGGATLTSITAYRDYMSSQAGDVDYGNVDILFRDEGAFREFQTFTQEFRLQGSAFDERLDWLVGAYYANEKLNVLDTLKFGNQYGAFAACRLVATINPAAVLRNPAAPGCLSPAGIGALTGAFGAAAPIFISGLNRLSTVNGVGDTGSLYEQDSENFAFFTHNIFDITDRLSLTLGLRYTSETKDFQADINNNNAACPVQQAFFAPFLTGGATPLPGSGANGLPATSLQALAQGLVNLTCQGNSSTSLNSLVLEDSRDEDEFSGTAVLSFKPGDDWLMYASYSRGYKAGGFNLDRSALGQPIFSPTDPRQFGGRNAGFNTANLQFDPEIVDAYEFGVKYDGAMFNLNVAAFRQDFKNFQLNTFNGSVFLVQNVNGCDDDLGTTTVNTISVPADQDPSSTSGACAPGSVGPGVRSQGVEVEASIYPGGNIAITAGVTYASTEFDDDLVGRDTGSPLDPALFLLPGDNLSNAPEVVVTGSFAWTPDIGNSGLSGLVYVDGRLTGDYNTGSDLFPEKEQDGFALVNARLGVRGPDERWAIEVWAQNLFNENYDQVAFNTPFQGSNSVAQIRDFGAQFGPAAQQANFGTGNQIFSAFLAEPRTYGITGRFRF